MSTPRYVAVVGAASATAAELALAEEVGALLARAGAVTLTGGLAGVMEAASRGARSEHGQTIGILPGDDRAAANGWVQIALPTGLGELSGGVVVRAADAVIAIGAGDATRSEVSLALDAGVPVVGLGTAEVHGLTQASTAAEAVGRTASAPSH